MKKLIFTILLIILTYSLVKTQNWIDSTKNYAVLELRNVSFQLDSLYSTNSVRNYKIQDFELSNIVNGIYYITLYYSNNICTRQRIYMIYSEEVLKLLIQIQKNNTPHPMDNNVYFNTKNNLEYRMMKNAEDSMMTIYMLEITKMTKKQ